MATCPKCAGSMKKNYCSHCGPRFVPVSYGRAGHPPEASDVPPSVSPRTTIALQSEAARAQAAFEAFQDA